MSKLEAALAYGRMGWRVFPCHSIVQAPSGPTCSCGKKGCNSPGKHPRIKQGFRGATDDALQIKAWWTKWPDGNIGLATGSGLAAFDIDGQEGANELKALVQAHGPLPATLTQSTGRGFHALFSTPDGSPEVRSSARGHVHVRGEGGYIIVPPSDHISGRKYQWIRKLPLAPLPDWLRQWSQGYEISGNRVVADRSASAFGHLGQLPAYLQSNQRSVTETASEALKTAYSPSEHARIVDALKAIPSANYEIWYHVGMALKTLDWERSDGTDIGLELFDQWSALCPEKYSQAACETKWRSFGRRAGITLGTVYHLAREHGWSGGLPSPPGAPQSGAHGPGLNGTANGVNGNHALPAAFLNAPQAIIWPDVNEDGKPRPTCANTAVAVLKLEIACAKDLFHEKFLVNGEPINAWAGEMSDDVIQMIRRTIRYRFGFDPKVENTRDACTQLCLDNQFNPITDYLDGLKWDGTPRLDTWLSRYMGAADTELNRAIADIVLIAAVRRARRPGTKFDEIVVFESVEGKGKSTAIEILAGPENFSDQHIIGISGKEQQEAMCGVWLYEIADLTGMKKTDVEQVKAFASRKVDRARPAYGRYRVDRPRSTVFFATTNDDEYLQSQTGNRRFWPVVVGRIDLDWLRRDRDQIWAEAAFREARGDSIRLPERLWHAAREQQESRVQYDEWLELISRWLDEKKPESVSATEVLCNNQYIQRRPDAVTSGDARRVSRIMQKLGWMQRRTRTGHGHPVRRYVKGNQPHA